MGKEIERKFLVDFESIENFNGKMYIRQGYIVNTPEKVVRIRITDDRCFLTIKGENDGAERPEFEYDIPRDDATEMLNTMCGEVIEKTRHFFHIYGDIWEIDVFHGDNEGLIIAEVEIPTKDYDLQLPSWVLKEVTDPKYYNNNLAIHPYKNW